MFKKEFLEAACFPEGNSMANVLPGPSRRPKHFYNRMDFMMGGRLDFDEITEEDILNAVRGVARMRTMALMGEEDPQERKKIEQVFAPIARRLDELSRKITQKPLLRVA